MYEGNPNPPASMTGWYSSAKFWAVPSDTPKGSCEAPSWNLIDSTTVLSKDTAINPVGWHIGGNDAYSVNIDHVFEVQLLNIFFYTRLMQQSTTQYYISCDDIQKVFDQVDDNSQPELGTRLNVTFNKLASYENPELLGISGLLNTKKAGFFQYKFVQNPNNGQCPIRLAKNLDPVYTTTQLAQFALTLNILQNKAVWSLFEITNSRIYQQFQRVDQLIQYRADSDCADKFLNAEGQPLAATWADSYSSWMTDKISAINTGLQIVATKALDAVPTENSNKFKAAKLLDEEIESTWVPWLATFTSAWPIAEMTLPDVTEWPIATPANFGPGDCEANPNSALTSAPITASAASLTSAPVTTVPATSPLVTVTSAVMPATTNAANASNGDPCGPQRQDTPNYPNTCNAKVDLVQSPAAYGVNCSSADPSYDQTKKTVTPMGWGNCASSISNICSGIGNSSNPTGYWIWSYQTEGCAVGVFLPPYQGSAPPPSTERCETLIFEAIVDSCSTTTIPSSMGSVNVVTIPDYMEGTSQGAQVNAGYPSYIVSPNLPYYMGMPSPPFPIPVNSGSKVAESPWLEPRPLGDPPPASESKAPVAQLCGNILD